MKESRADAADDNVPSLSVMGKTFDPAKPEDYLAQLQDQEGVVMNGRNYFAARRPGRNAATHTPRALRCSVSTGSHHAW